MDERTVEEANAEAEHQRSIKDFWVARWTFTKEERDEARTIARRLYKENERLMGFMKQLEDIAPGGEFHNSPQNCIDFLNNAPKMVVKKQLELRGLKAENEVLRMTLKAHKKTIDKMHMAQS